MWHFCFVLFFDCFLFPAIWADKRRLRRFISSFDGWMVLCKDLIVAELSPRIIVYAARNILV